ncbi:LPS-assembly protein LptD [Pseudoroseomonas globiformis]|uniref:LPS-assembly protein LptD n=1 Tax=Teichococcus globiformis TaxID=2307229 RepID=A0ABV7G5T4_9PROT
MDRAPRDATPRPDGCPTGRPARDYARWTTGWRGLLLGSAALIALAAPRGEGRAQGVLGTSDALRSGGPGSIPVPEGTPSPTISPAAAAAPAPPPAPLPPGARDPSQTGNNAPVTFTAEQVEYDRDNNRVTATGAVEAWQNDRILRADRFTYNRETGIATVEGNVQLLQPDGQVLFADRADLTGNLRDGVLQGLSARLAQNGRMVANGARRTDGSILDMSRVLYSSCDLCADDPEAAPLWQLRARLATHDQAEKRLRYRDASLLFGGVPVFWTPYLSHPDPSVPRQSGFLTPSFGSSSFLGGFIETPYYWAIDDSSDAIISPTFSTKQDPALGLDYRRRFNAGEIKLNGSVGQRDGARDEEGLGGHIFSSGQFAIDENWRTGFNLNRASSESYLRAWRYPAQRQLVSDLYLESFWGTESFFRADTRFYQGLSEVDDTGQIPLVLPNLYGDRWFGRDRFGGFLTLDANAFAISRSQGTDTRRFASRITYERPQIDSMGSVWTFRGQADGIGRWVDDFDRAPNFGNTGTVNDITGNVRLGLDWRMPFIRSAGNYGSQLLEPRVQLVTGPATGRQTDVPNEDSYGFEFTDANLFQLNRFYGRDRQEGGTRVDAALRGAWYFPNGGQLEAMAGRSFRTTEAEVFQEDSGLRDKASDWVGRVRLSPTPWLDLIARTRLDKDGLDARLVETQGRISLGPVALNASYLYTTPSDALISTRERREVAGGVQTRLGRFWSVGAFGRYDLELNRSVNVGGNLTYEDECLIFATHFSKSYAEPSTRANYYPSETVLLFRLSFKTIGDFGFRAI